MKNPIRKKLHKLAHKIIIALSILASLILFLFYRQMENGIKLRIELECNNIVSHFEKTKLRTFTFSKLIAKDTQIIKGTTKTKTSIIQESMLEYSKLMDISFGVIHDLDGFSLSKIHKPDEFFNDESDETYVKNAFYLKKQIEPVITNTEEGLVLIASVPIFSLYNKEKIIGFASSGYHLDDAFANTLKHNEEIEVLFVENTNIIGKTFGNNDELVDLIPFDLSSGQTKKIVYKNKIFQLKNYNLTNSLNLIILLDITKQAIILFLSISFLLVFFIIAIIIISFATMQKKLLDWNSELEEQVKLRTEELNIKNIYLTDSINYAQRIQSATLPETSEIAQNFKEFSLIYLPLNIVSGDFFWYHKNSSDIFIATVDCTGHGVPGALLAAMGNMLLNRYIHEQNLTELDEILEKIDSEFKDILKTNEGSKYSEGMDLSICKINKKDSLLTFAGARNSLVYISKSGKLNRIKGSRRSIGDKRKKRKIDFEVHNLNLYEIDYIYMFTDGYVDQLNTENKSITYSNFSQNLIQIKDKPLEEQKKILLNELNEHKKGQRQTDDITVMAIKV